MHNKKDAVARALFAEYQASILLPAYLLVQCAVDKLSFGDGLIDQCYSLHLKLVQFLCTLHKIIVVVENGDYPTALRSQCGGIGAGQFTKKVNSISQVYPTVFIDKIEEATF